jgi:hypothetical protein
MDLISDDQRPIRFSKQQSQIQVKSFSSSASRSTDFNTATGSLLGTAFSLDIDLNKLKILSV